MGERPLWTCPRCGARFVTRNIGHGCGAYTVDGFFEGKSARLRELYEAWVALVGEFGRFEQVPTKSRIAFMVRVRFAGVARLPKDGLVCGFWLKRQISSPRVLQGRAPREARLGLPGPPERGRAG